MLSQTLLLAALNRVLANQPAIQNRLARHAGKGFGIRLPLGTFQARIGEGGALQPRSGEPALATEIEVGAAVLARLAAGDRDALREARVRGDGVLANDLSAVLRLFDWALALRPYVGDIAAARAAQGIAGLQAWRDSAAESIGRSVAEYAAFEAPLLADTPSVQRFVAEVDGLRDDVARLAARIGLLEQRRGRGE